MREIGPHNHAEVKSELEALTRTPGWRLFQEWVQRMEKQMILQVSTEENPDRLLRLAGALKLNTDVKNFVQNTIEGITRQEKKHAADVRKNGP